MTALLIYDTSCLRKETKQTNHWANQVNISVSLDHHHVQHPAPKKLQPFIQGGPLQVINGVITLKNVVING